MTVGRAPLYRYRFGSAEFDESRFELRVGGLLVDLQQKPLQLLALLLASPGEAVDKETIFAQLWGGRATGDAVLANAVSKLRTALGEQNEARIVTVPRRGYRFDGDLERQVVGRRLASQIKLQSGEPAPGRESYWLSQLLASNVSNETWLIRHPKTGDQRILKFAVDGEQLTNLKREVTLYRVLRESLGDRPCFVRILDWNFEQAPYWIESEYAGRSLDSWANSQIRDLPREQRLSLLLQIVDAAAAAHEAGVLHKDLKPANILLEDHDNGVRVRLGDFGSGRVIDADRMDALNITRLGLTVASNDASDSGTPLYIAPEQLAGQAPSARSDLYALGVIGFQLLAGDLKRPMAPGWERAIDDELLIVDLARATDVDPARRFDSVAEFASQLRALDRRREELATNREMAAHAEAERASVAATRARRPWVIAAMLFLALGAAAALLLFAREQRASAELASQLSVSAALNRLLQEDIIGAANPANKGRANVTVADALAQAATQVDRKFAEQPARVRAPLHAAMQSSLSELSRSIEAVEAGRRAVASWESAGSVDRVALQEARLRLAVDLVQLSRLDEAAKVVAAIDKDAATMKQSDAFRARLLFAKAWVTAGEFALQESTAHLEAARALVENKTEAQAPWRDKILFGLADNYTMLGRHQESETLFRKLVTEQTRSLGDTHARTSYSLLGLGLAVMNQNRLDEAQGLLTRAAAGLNAALGPRHRQTLTALDLLAQVLFRKGDYLAAADQWRVAHEGFTALVGAGSSYAITIETTRAVALHRAGRLGQAEPMLRSALQRARAILPNESPQVQQIRYALSECLLDANRPQEVAVLLENLDATALNLAQPEPDWPDRLARQRARLPR